jgi:asparagine synthase (glutamine-hydrolysing)
VIGHKYLGLARLDGLEGDDRRCPIAPPAFLTQHCEGRHCRVHMAASSASGWDGRPLVVGQVFNKGDGASQLSPDAVSALDADALKWEQELWGNFVVIDDGAHEVSVSRSALGRLPCYFMEFDGWLVFASDIELLSSCRDSGLGLDWEAVTDHLAYPHLRRERTCLEGVRELIGGQTMTLTATGLDVRTHWTPWSAIPRRPSDIAVGDAARTIRSAVMQSIGALSRGFEHIVLGVSGGLDSAIVACALANFGHRATLVTQVTHDPRGDERDYARILAKGVGLPLEEHFEDLGLVDPCRSQSAHLPRPLARSFAQSGNAIMSEVAAGVGGDAYFTGGGGDNVFCYLQSPAPVADLLLQGRVLRALQCSSDLGRMTGAGTAKALRLGAARAFLRSPNYRWPRDTRFLSAAAAEKIRPGPLHPWLAYPRRNEPGASGHVAAILAIENHLEGYARELTLPVVHPLVSKPLVEAALTIPAWMWCAGGRNRAVARAAFADLLPRQIVERQTKGAPDGFVAQVYAHYHSRIREFLLDGVLLSHGILDGHALEAGMTGDGPVTGTDYARLLSICDVEAWCRQRLP